MLAVPILTIVVSTAASLVINDVGLDPVEALVWSSMINGFVAPPLLVATLVAANKPAVMAGRTNGLLVNVLGWTAVVVMATAAIASLVV